MSKPGLSSGVRNLKFMQKAAMANQPKDAEPAANPDEPQSIATQFQEDLKSISKAHRNVLSSQKLLVDESLLSVPALPPGLEVDLVSFRVVDPEQNSGGESDGGESDEGESEGGQSGAGQSDPRQSEVGQNEAGQRDAGQCDAGQSDITNPSPESSKKKHKQSHHSDKSRKSDTKRLEKKLKKYGDGEETLGELLERRKHAKDREHKKHRDGKFSDKRRKSSEKSSEKPRKSSTERKPSKKA